MNYFEHFGIPVSFILDEGNLKKLFIIKSREYHPDFFTLEEKDTQDKMLEMSSFNNKGYKILKDFNSRTKYILELNNAIEEEGSNKIPQDFLMEMMDINEEVMDLQMDYNKELYNRVLGQLDDMESTMYKDILPTLNLYNHESPEKEDLERIKDFYFKSKYLWRLRENLDKFATW